MKTNIKTLSIKGNLMTFECGGMRGLKAIVDHRSGIPPTFAFSEDAVLNAQAVGASFMGILTPSEVCLCLIASGETAIDETGAKTIFFHSKDAI